jgi:hypothetical protein
MLIHLLLREYRLREGRYPDSLEPLTCRSWRLIPSRGSRLAIG